jgi:hypothetical protein
MNPGGREESIVVSVAVQEALVALEAPAGVHVTAAPRFAPPFRNCTVPVGPCAELLFVFTVALSVTLPPAVMLLGLGTTVVDVVACVMVIDSELLLELEL